MQGAQDTLPSAKCRQAGAGGQDGAQEGRKEEAGSWSGNVPHSSGFNRYNPAWWQPTVSTEPQCGPSSGPGPEDGTKTPPVWLPLQG